MSETIRVTALGDGRYSVSDGDIEQAAASPDEARAAFESWLGDQPATRDNGQ